MSDKISDEIDRLNLEKVQTEMTVKQLIKGKTTPGDLIFLTFKPAQDDVVPKMNEELAKGPVDWGNAKILSWKKTEAGEITVLITSYTPGTLEIKPIPFVTSKEKKPVFATQPLSLQIDAVEGEAEKDDIYPPSPIKIPQWVFLAGSFGTLILILIVFYIVSRLRKKKDQPAKPTAPPLNPIEEFQRTKAAIESFHFLDRDQFKPYYFGYSDAAKKFLGKAYHCDSEDKTTRELMELLREVGMGEELRSLWKMILDEMDIVKFTDKIPESEAAKNLSSRIDKIVTTSWNFSPHKKELKEKERVK